MKQLNFFLTKTLITISLFSSSYGFSDTIITCLWKNPIEQITQKNSNFKHWDRFHYSSYDQKKFDVFKRANFEKMKKIIGNENEFGFSLSTPKTLLFKFVPKSSLQTQRLPWVNDERINSVKLNKISNLHERFYSNTSSQTLSPRGGWFTSNGKMPSNMAASRLIYKAGYSWRPSFTVFDSSGGFFKIFKINS